MSFDPAMQDRTIVEHQLGRPLRAKWRVAKRCHLGIPMVVENYPLLDDGTPFPTRFWLTCPVLVKRLSRLEATGSSARISEGLAERPALRERLAAAMRRYIDGRDKMAKIEDSGAPPGGGPDKIKCLHAHTAHELAEPGNPVGSIALERTGWPDCRVLCVGVGEST
jgi:uncharacterized protein